MDAPSIGLLILAIVLAAIYWVCGLFIEGRIHRVVGVICIVIFLIRFATVLLSIMARLH